MSLLSFYKTEPSGRASIIENHPGPKPSNPTKNSTHTDTFAPQHYQHAGPRHCTPVRPPRSFLFGCSNDSDLAWYFQRLSAVQIQLECVPRPTPFIQRSWPADLKERHLSRTTLANKPSPNQSHSCCKNAQLIRAIHRTYQRALHDPSLPRPPLICQSRAE